MMLVGAPGILPSTAGSLSEAKIGLLEAAAAATIARIGGRSSHGRHRSNRCRASWLAGAANPLSIGWTLEAI